MELGTLLVLLLLLACPLLMVWMMRGDHGHAHGGHAMPGSLDDLRRRRAELDTEIGLLECTKREATTPVEPDPAQE